MDDKHRPGPRLLRAAAGPLAAAVLLLAACSAPDRATSTAVHPAWSVSSSAPPAQRMTSRDDLQSPYPIQWDSWRAAGPRAVEVTFLAGPASCDGVRATVQETDRQVTIALAEGSPPGSADCEDIALETVLTVTLTQPLGTRPVRQPQS